MQVEPAGCSYSEGIELLCRSCLIPRNGPCTVPSWALTRGGGELRKAIEPKTLKVESEGSEDLHQLFGTLPLRGV